MKERLTNLKAKLEAKVASPQTSADDRVFYEGLLEAVGQSIRDLDAEYVLDHRHVELFIGPIEETVE